MQDIVAFAAISGLTWLIHFSLKYRGGMIALGLLLNTVSSSECMPCIGHDSTELSLSYFPCGLVSKNKFLIRTYGWWRQWAPTVHGMARLFFPLPSRRDVYHKNIWHGERTRDCTYSRTSKSATAWSLASKRSLYRFGMAQWWLQLHIAQAPHENLWLLMCILGSTVWSGKFFDWGQQLMMSQMMLAGKATSPEREHS